MAELSPLQRALRILQLLSVREHITVNELYSYFERRETIRTLQRTLESIESAGIGLVRRKGPHGEHQVSLQRRFQFIPELLSADEALAAILLAQFGEHFSGSPVGESLNQVIEKLEQLLPGTGVIADHGLLDMDEKVRFKSIGRLPIKAPGRVLLDLLQAILNQHRCQLEYGRPDLRGKGREYLVEPYSLVLSNGAIYLIAYHQERASYLHFALHRIQQVRDLGDTFLRNPDFQLGDFLNGAFGIWQATAERVKIHLSAEVSDYAMERVWHPSQQTELLPDDSLMISMDVGLSGELEAWILRWGTHAEVLQPESLRQRIHGIHKAAAAKYEAKS